MKTSQVTVFIIMGIVIVAVFAFSFFIISLVTQENLVSDPSKAVVERSVVDSIRKNVQSCFEESFKDGLLLLGEQGGYIYGWQGGGVIDFEVPALSYHGKNVSVRLDKASLDSFPYGNDLNSMGFIPSLCNQSMIRNGYSCACNDVDESNCRYSIQSQLEAYVLNKTKECFNPSMFPGYDLAPGDSSAVVVFGKSDVTSNLLFPLTIQYLGGQPISEVFDFQSVQKVKFAFLYDTIFWKGSLIRKDALNLTFDIVDRGSEVLKLMFRNFRLPASEVWITVDKVEPFDGDIVILNDTSSRINGLPYIFQFARRNRPPLLDYISIDPRTIDGEYYDIYMEQGETLEIRPMGYDPDEDDLRYEYSGWLENPNIWHESALYRITGCPDVLTGKDDLFRCVSYDLQVSDLGEHELTVAVKDPEGLSDSQKLKIFIAPIP